MKQIDDYIEAICQDIDGDSEELAEIKAEMRSHLLEAVEELKAQGKSEEESIYIALSRFGDRGDIQSGLKEVLQQQKRFARNILRIALGFLAAGILCFTLFMVQHFYKDYIDHQEQNAISHLEHLLEENPEVTPKLKKKIREAVNTYNRIQFIAVFDRDKVLTETPPYQRSDNIVTVIKDPKTKEYQIVHPEAAFEIESQPSNENSEGKNFYLGFPNLVGDADFFYDGDSEKIEPASSTLFGSFQSWKQQPEKGNEYSIVNKRWIEVKMATYHWWDRYSSLLILIIFASLIVYWVLFSIWLIITAHHEGRLSPAWIVAFITLNFFAYILYRSDQKRRNTPSS